MILSRLIASSRPVTMSSSTGIVTVRNRKIRRISSVPTVPLQSLFLIQPRNAIVQLDSSVTSYSSSSSSSLSLPSSAKPSVRTARRMMMVPAITKRWQSDDSRITSQHHDDDHQSDGCVDISFIQPDETIRTVQARVGDSFLQVAHKNGIDLEGACEGVCACSTCHLIFPPDVYDTLPDPSEEEEDMLDMAFGLTESSRLGCQIIVTKEMDGMEVEMPKATRNFYVDGHVPKPH